MVDPRSGANSRQCTGNGLGKLVGQDVLFLRLSVHVSARCADHINSFGRGRCLEKYLFLKRFRLHL